MSTPHLKSEKRNIPYGRQEITDEDIRAVERVLKSDYLTQGPEVSGFEEDFSRYIGAKYSIAVANGTAALHLCAMALGVEKGSKVLSSPISFAASSNCIAYCGGEVDFVDIDPATFLIDIDSLERKLTSSPPNTYAGIVSVDFAGLPVDLKRLRDIADRHGMWIIEDACHAPGGSFRKGSLEYRCGDGSLADLAIFSFHPVKHIASGEGGMITTNNSKLAKRIEVLRTHGITKDPTELRENHGGWYYEMQELGYNYRLSDIHSALGRSQLRRAEEGLSRRTKIADRYCQELADLPIEFQSVPSGYDHAYHLFVILSDMRDELYIHLREQGIYTQIHYIPIHTLPYYQDLGWRKGDFPNSEHYYGRCLSLPMYPSLSDSDQTFVIEQIRSFHHA